MLLLLCQCLPSKCSHVFENSLTLLVYFPAACYSRINDMVCVKCSVIPKVL